MPIFYRSTCERVPSSHPQFIKLLFIVNHFLPAQPCYRVIFAQEKRFVGADFFAQPAVDAANHVDLKFLRKFFDLSPSALLGNFTGANRYCTRRTDELAQLTRNASFAAIFVLNQSRCSAVVSRQFLIPGLLRILHCHFLSSRKYVQEVTNCDP